MASDLAVIDELTQIHNRRFINKQIPLYVIKNHLEGTPISVIMADIDRFKAVNDRYGHICGDCVLKQFAGILADSVRTDNGIVARYGGDEFLILLDRTDGKTAFNISEKLRKTIENACFPYETHQIKITASFGIYMIDENCVSIDKIINHVDKKLYQAKKAGRNKSAK
jgi:diguanylate cyclase (GGDEF)-like protein